MSTGNLTEIINMKKDAFPKSYYMEKEIHDKIIMLSKKEKRSASWWLNEHIKKLITTKKK